MFNLGFTMEELMFPENYSMNFFYHMETNYFIDKFNEISSIENDDQQQICIKDDDDDDDDDWFTIKHLNSGNDNNTYMINDQILPLENYHLEQVPSNIDIDDTITALFLSNLSVNVTCDRENISDTNLNNSYSFSYEQRLSKLNNISEQTNRHLTSKSTSSLSFRTQSSTSITNSSIDEISVHSNDFNETNFNHHLNDSLQKCLHHHHHHHHNNHSLKMNSRRRRKRTIFTSADIEYLKQAFLQNPKPSQQDIAILSEQLGHDSYVIRVWFYNKRQATKKRMN